MKRLFLILFLIFGYVVSSTAQVSEWLRETLLLDSASTDSVYVPLWQHRKFGGQLILVMEQTDSLKNGTELDNLTIWVKTAARSLTGTRLAVGDSLAIDAAVDLDLAPETVKAYSLTKAFDISTSYESFLEGTGIFLYAKNEGGVAADSANITIRKLVR